MRPWQTYLVGVVGRREWLRRGGVAYRGSNGSVADLGGRLLVPVETF